MARRKYKPKPPKKMSERKKQKLRHFVENHMNKKDKPRKKYPTLTKKHGVVIKPKGDKVK